MGHDREGHPVKIPRPLGFFRAPSADGTAYNETTVSSLRKTRFRHEAPQKSCRMVLKVSQHQDAQNGRPARPQRVKRRGVRGGTLSL